MHAWSTPDKRDAGRPALKRSGTGTVSSLMPDLDYAHVARSDLDNATLGGLGADKFPI